MSKENVLEWEIIIHSDSKYIEIVTKGVADKAGSMAMAKKIAETMRHHRFTKAIIDHRQITGISGDVVDIYDRPGLLKVIGLILGIKVAEIINPEHLEHFRFLETVFRNRGYNFSIFYEKPKAVEWLLG